MMAPIAPVSMTARQLAAHYGVHRDTVYAWLDRGWLGREGAHWFRLGGKEYRFRSAALEFLEGRSWENHICGNTEMETGASAGPMALVTDAFLAGQLTAPRLSLNSPSSVQEPSRP